MSNYFDRYVASDVINSNLSSDKRLGAHVDGHSVEERGLKFCVMNSCFDGNRRKSSKYKSEGNTRGFNFVPSRGVTNLRAGGEQNLLHPKRSITYILVPLDRGKGREREVGWTKALFMRK